MTWRACLFTLAALLGASCAWLGFAALQVLVLAAATVTEIGSRVTP